MPPKSLLKKKLVDVKKTIIKNPRAQVAPTAPVIPVIITTKKPLIIQKIVVDTPELETIEPIVSIGKLPKAPKYIEPPKDRPTLASQPTLEPTEENDSEQPRQPKYIAPPSDRPTLAAQPTLEPTEENASGQPKYIEPQSDRGTLEVQATLEPETTVEKFSMPFITKTLSGTYSTPIYIITEKYGYM